MYHLFVEYEGDNYISFPKMSFMEAIAKIRSLRPIYIRFAIRRPDSGDTYALYYNRDGLFTDRATYSPIVMIDRRYNRRGH